jgi:exopolysaccharide biosynthesis protein
MEDEKMGGRRFKTISEKKTVNKLLINIMAFIIAQGLVFCAFSFPMVYYGPFNNIKEMLVTSAMTTMNHKYIATWFLSQSEIENIMNKNKIDDAGQKSDVAAIAISTENENTKKDTKKDEIQFVDISTDKIKGYMLMVTNPDRISIATSNKIGNYGMKLDDMVKTFNAVAGINAGGFSDENGKGNGGIPQGLLIQDGKVIYGNEKEVYSVIGFNEDSVLVLGKYTLKEVREKKIRDAATFEPFLIVNGEPMIKSGNGGWGLAPRTAIGQTKDGTVLLLVIDGRQLSSLGATLKDVQDIMLSYGAYNAANLDGGSSTTMVYNGKIINTPSSQYGPRYLPSAFIVK